MYKICLIGGEHIVGGFKALGIDVFPSETYEVAREHFKEVVAKREHAIIIITERIAKEIFSDIKKVEGDPFFSIVLIPDNKGSINLAKERIRGLSKRALGTETIVR